MTCGTGASKRLPDFRQAPPLGDRELNLPGAILSGDDYPVAGNYAGRCLAECNGRFASSECMWPCLSQYDDDWSEHGDESGVALVQVAAGEKAKVVYVYDFGDDWRHDIVVEKILPAVPGVANPRCTGERGETPAEDSGGIWAFKGQRALDGVPDGRFDPADVTTALATLADVVTPAT